MEDRRLRQTREEEEVARAKSTVQQYPDLFGQARQPYIRHTDVG